MLIPDVNVLLNAYRSDAEDHARASEWLLAAGNGDEPVGIPPTILLSFARIATTYIRGVRFMTPEAALIRCSEIRAMPSRVPVAEGVDHWGIFGSLVTASGISGSRFTDAYLAAFAIEHEATFVTFDRGFQRFRGLKLLTLG
jgi:toxin-antitoxin system PIN domain toxin